MKKKRDKKSTAYVEKEFMLSVDESTRKDRVVSGIRRYLKDSYQEGKKALQSDIDCMDDLLSSVVEENATKYDDLTYAYIKVEQKVRKDERVELPIEDIVIQDGFLFSDYSVTTEDGYILQLHRVWSPHFDDPSVSKPVVFFMHGLLSSSEAFLLNGENG